MPDTSPLRFGPFRLAGPNGPLFRGNEQLKLKPKALAVLWLLARQAGQVVTKTALLDAIWPKTFVGEDALASQIQALRRVLEDDARESRYIATLHRIGYRFIAPVTSAAPVVSESPRAETAIVGRDAELARLHEHYAKALRGERQLLLVSGEAGIGKTALVESFLAEVKESPRIGRGQCVEQHGAGEGYLPVLEALGRICREPRGAEVVDVLLRIAPTWLQQLPAVLSTDDVAALERRTAGATHERMLREIADALEVLGSETPLILVLEDLHWSDPSTIEMLALVARRTERARLLVVGTYRPADVILSGHPLKPMKQELTARGKAVEIPLGNLRPSDVRTYLTRRFPERGDESELSAFVYRRTEGHPLFMIQVADYLAQQEATVLASLEDVVPLGLRELIEVQLGRLTDADRQVLEVASAAGAEFAVASVAAGAEHATDDVEARCGSLVRHGQFIEERGLATWPDGTVSGRYGFRHALYRDVLYRGLNERQRTGLHLAIGTRQAAGYGERSGEIAAELAAHFEQGGDVPRAILHLQRAGEKALERSANAEAVAHFDRGLDLLETSPDTAERARQELRLRLGASLALTMIKGYSAPEVERANARARELSEQMEETPEIASAVFRLYQSCLSRAELETAHALAERLLRIADRAESPALRSRAHNALAFELASRGDFTAARDHAEQSLAVYDPRELGALGDASGDDPGAVAQVVRNWVLQVLGRPDEAEESMRKCMAAAEALSLPYAVCAILTSLADFHMLRRAGRAVRQTTEAAIAIAARDGFPYFHAKATILRGWALAEEGQTEAGIAELGRGLAAFRSMGAGLWMPRYLGLLAEAYGKAEHFDEGLAMLAEARETATRTGEREYEAELHRLEGELLLESKGAKLGGRDRRPASPEDCFLEAIAVARKQGAKLFELRSTVSLARFRQRQARTREAHEALAEVYGRFNEGFETADLTQAKALLEELAAKAEPTGAFRVRASGHPE